MHIYIYIERERDVDYTYSAGAPQLHHGILCHAMSQYN